MNIHFNLEETTMTKATRGRPARFNADQMADIAYAYYTADRGK